MTATRTPTRIASGEDRCLRLAWPHPTRPPGTAGLVAVLAPHAAAAWADNVLADDDTGPVVWTGTGRRPERYAMATRERLGVRAVALAPAGADPCQVHVALQLARRLAVLRSGCLRPTRAYLTSPTRPGTPHGMVRIPHLVTIVGGANPAADAVVWELTTRAETEEWLGRPLPDPTPIEAGLPRLLALRRAARTGDLPDNPAGHRLAALLHGRPLPLSIQLVYRHPDVFADLLTAGPSDATDDSAEPA